MKSIYISTELIVTRCPVCDEKIPEGTDNDVTTLQNLESHVDDFHDEEWRKFLGPFTGEEHIDFIDYIEDDDDD